MIDDLSPNARRLLLAVIEAFGGAPFTQDDIATSQHPAMVEYRAWCESQVAIEIASERK